jgi:hypothetical protein
VTAAPAAPPPRRWSVVLDAQGRPVQAFDRDDTDACHWSSTPCGGCSKCLLWQAAHAEMTVIDVDQVGFETLGDATGRVLRAMQNEAA